MSSASAAGITIVYDAQVPHDAGQPRDRRPDVRAGDAADHGGQFAVVQGAQTERSILVFPDNQQKHAQYDEQVLQTFYVSHADVADLTQLLEHDRPTADAWPCQPAIQFNKTANTITVRATAPIVQIIERVIDAERQGARRDHVRRRDSRGQPHSARSSTDLNLTEYALGGVLSPEVAPDRHDHHDRHTAGEGTRRPPRLEIDAAVAA